VEVRAWQRVVLGVLLVGAIAIAGIALNFSLLRLTQDSHDPVGKLSPRSVFMGTTSSGIDTGTSTGTSTGEVTTEPIPPAADDNDRDD
jgi:hypothetical protein